ncbi:MAG: aminodeoxychorismate synthase component I [Ignavibacteriaceae bacterium]
MKLRDIIKQVETKPHSAFFFTPLLYPNSYSYLFLEPVEIITVNKKEDVKNHLKIIGKYLQRGLTGYALINYEAGYLFEKKLEKYLTGEGQKLIRFLFFDDKNIIRLKSDDIEFDADDISKYSITDFKLNTSLEKFKENIKKIKNYIREGDTYQVNYTVKGKFNFSGSYSTFFQHLLFNQSGKYSAFINDDESYIISLSPEKFFSIKGRKITSKPMKGTVKRGVNNEADLATEHELVNSKKNRAENVMIVDLIRNDLGRIAEYGSVTVLRLFSTEKYESLFQMVSTITAELKKEVTLRTVLKNIFPCGSVTGAPKIRTMEIINELEKEERGIYTGSIGLFNKDEASFNVAIRTLTVNRKTGNGELGIGSGIVWDSEPQKEYEETLLKSKFLTEPENYFDLFETMLAENGKILFLEEHLKRLRLAAEFSLFNFKGKKIRKSLDDKIVELDPGKKFKIKLILNKWGRIKIETSDLPFVAKIVKIIISEKKISTQNKFQYFKTTNRKLYDEEYQKYFAKGFFDVIFLNEKDEVAEGSITNIFIKKGNSWLTPPLTSGILNGIYCSHLLNNNDIKQKLITIEDLLKADEIKLVNSVRGEIRVNQVYYRNEIIEL